MLARWQYRDGRYARQPPGRSVAGPGTQYPGPPSHEWVWLCPRQPVLLFCDTATRSRAQDCAPLPRACNLVQCGVVYHRLRLAHLPLAHSLQAALAAGNCERYAVSDLPCTRKAPESPYGRATLGELAPENWP